jgi:tetratricopeptide (TPR) repeat protein
MAELTDDAHERIQKLSAEGDAFAEAGRYPDALKKYWDAWDLLPEPQTDWEAATWLLAAIGDANFLVGDYEAGRDNLSNAMHCPGAIGNPFLHLRLGQCQLELGNDDRAADELARAYMAAGHEIFEDQDPKYLTFLKTKLDPPPGGWEGEKKKPWWKPW